MKNYLIIAVLVLVLLVTAGLYAAGKKEKKDSTETSIEVSGRLEDGLRWIPVDLKKKVLQIMVFRGDYIVFETGDNKTHKLTIPSLGVEKQIPVHGTETPYIKMKEDGEYEFTLDDSRGIIRVVAYGGPQYWEVSAAEGVKLIKNIRPFILDVRTEGEYNEGHIEGAFLLPVQVLENQIALLEKYKNEDIFVYCHSGNRSTVSSKILIDAGFTKIHNLRYGISDWQAKGNPVVTD